MKSSMRGLVENYYDIQKLRMANFNRLVSWVRRNSDLIRKKIMSHSITENHISNASQYSVENQYTYAKLLPLLDKADAKELEKRSTDDKSKKRIGNEHYSAATKQLIKIDGMQFGEDYDNMRWLHNELRNMEAQVKRRIDLWVRKRNIYAAWLKEVKGVGPIIAGCLLAWLEEPSKYATRSHMWAYCGLAPGQKRTKGQKSNWNSELKKLAWKIGRSFVKQKDSFGRSLYDKHRRECDEKHPDWSKLHRMNWATRKTVKVFLACLWEEWRHQEGLEVPPPYSVKFLGHARESIIKPKEWIS